MRQLFLGRGPGDEVHKGMTGNSMLIAQSSPGYDQTLPNLSSLNDGLVVLFCKSVDDVSKAQMLIVERERYRQMMQHRQKVCPTFAEVVLDHAAVDRLPQAGVRDVAIQAAQSMPEAASVQTVIQGPASRIPMFCRPEKEQSDGSEDERNSNDGCVDPHHAATLGTSASPPEGGDPHPTKAMTCCLPSLSTKTKS